ncbi:MAG: pyridoxamine 5'-phosphate oxidase family protein [Ktedonobacteraceae bacterium]|jgi:general stress protein 26
MDKGYSHNDDIKLLGEKIKGIRVAMMTTVGSDGTLRSRPMATLDREFDGDLWFFTYASAPKVGDVEQHQQVNISYVDPDDSRYVSISGRAQIVRDREKMEQLWKPFLKAWFPGGLEEPDLALLKVGVESAEYWDASSSKMVRLANVAKALVTGQRDQQGENQKLDMK